MQQRAGLAHGTQVSVSPFSYSAEQPRASAKEQKAESRANTSCHLRWAGRAHPGVQGPVPPATSFVQAAVPGRQWQGAGAPLHPEPLSWKRQSVIAGSLLPQAQEKFWLSFSLVTSACCYPSLCQNKEVSQTHAIRGNCLRLTLTLPGPFKRGQSLSAAAQKTQKRCAYRQEHEIVKTFFPLALCKLR